MSSPQDGVRSGSGHGVRSSAATVAWASARHRLMAAGLALVAAAFGAVAMADRSAAVPAAAPVGETLVAVDSMSRYVPHGFGRAETGGVWSVSADAPTAVSSGVAHIEGLRGGHASIATLGSTRATDVGVLASFELPSLPVVGGGVYLGVASRIQADGSGYRIRARVQPGGRLSLSVVRAAKGRETPLGDTAVVTRVSAGQRFVVETSVTGTAPVTIRSRTWRSSTAKPAWQSTRVDASSQRIIAAGRVGTWVYVSAATESHSVLLDDIRAVSPAPVPTPSRPPTPTPASTSRATPIPTGSTGSPTAPSPSGSSAAPSAGSTSPDPVPGNPSTTSPGAVPVGTASYAVPTSALFVAPIGDDAAAGTLERPLRTVSRAVALARNGDTIVLRAGVYHESVNIYSKRLVVQAYPHEAVWFDGSSLVAGWTHRGSTWVHDGWTSRMDHSSSFTYGHDDLAFLAVVNPMAPWPDQVFVDGRQLRQVASSAGVGPGQFAVDYAAKTITIGDNPEGREVRASDLAQALNVNSAGSSLRGFGVRRYGTPLPALGTVRLAGGSNTARDLVIADNATQGLSFQNSNNAVDHITVSGNGMTGIHANNADQLQITNSVIRGNNTEQFNPSTSAGGIKITQTRGVTVSNNDISGNFATGLWTDQSVVRFTFVGNTLVNNWIGLETELSDTGIVATNRIVGGKYGLYVLDTGNVKVFNNLITGNSVASLLLSQDERREADPSIPAHDRRQPIPDPSCPWITRNVLAANNVFPRSGGGGSFQFYALDKRTNTSASSMNLAVQGNLFARRDTAADPTMVGWGGSDNVTVTRYETPAALNLGLGTSWRNLQAGDGSAAALSASTVASVALPLPADVAGAIGVVSGSQRIGPF